LLTVADQKGRYFSGDYTYLENAPQIFFPAAGRRSFHDGYAYVRGDYGYYWSSRPGSSYAYYLYFSSSGVDMSYYDSRAYGFSVRCVQATDEVAEL
jgi:uncharacterized protein (TIGR02145 family)